MSGQWRRVAGVGELPPGEIKGLEIDGRRIALYNVEGRFYATDNVCTHAFALLSDGWLEGAVVECPLHGGKFEVATGKAMGDPVDCDIRTFPVRIADGEVEVFVEA